MKNRIEHDGIVKRIDSNELIVSILNKAACLSCQVKGACSMSEIEEKEIEIKKDPRINYEIGEKVKVYYGQELGFFALFLGYLMPFILLISILIIGKSLGYSEGAYGLASVGSLLPYYLILYLFKNRIKNTFRFSIQKVGNLSFNTDFKIINN